MPDCRLGKARQLEGYEKHCGVFHDLHLCLLKHALAFFPCCPYHFGMFLFSAQIAAQAPILQSRKRWIAVLIISNVCQRLRSAVSGILCEEGCCSACKVPRSALRGCAGVGYHTRHGGTPRRRRTAVCDVLFVLALAPLRRGAGWAPPAWVD